jgi:hypothetical protein
MTESPYRNDSATMPCPRCSRSFAPIGRQRYCSTACRQATWRRRHAAPLPVLPLRVPRSGTVYACLACGARFLGEQRCPDCNQFCRRIGPGGPCPHCDEPVALADLLGARQDVR